jgi:predicted DNA-binding transcriptional regulator AlpA
METAVNNNAEDYIMPQEGFVRQPVVLKVLGISKSTLWRRIQDGTYPRPVKLSPRTSAWRVKDIRALIRRYDEPEVADCQTP